MSEIRFKTSGTCSRYVNVELEDGKVKSVRFEGGCAGNTQGVAKLIDGMDINVSVLQIATLYMILSGRKKFELKVGDFTLAKSTKN